MKCTSIFILCILTISNGMDRVVLDGANPTDTYATAELRNDPRGLNVVSNNEWALRQISSNLLRDWGFIVTLEAERYGFKSGVDGSSVSISLDGYCVTTSNCEGFFGFGIGTNQYLTFATDFDAGLRVRLVAGQPVGLFAYPPPSGGDVASGDADTVITDWVTANPSITFGITTIRASLAGGSAVGWYLLTDPTNFETNGNNWPLNFTFTNNDLSGTFSFKFESPSFAGNDALEVVYNKVDTDQDFKLFFTPDFDTERTTISKVIIEGYDFAIIFKLVS